MMSKVYFFDCWHEAPEHDCRFLLKNVNENLWMPLSEAIKLLSELPPPTIATLRECFAWRCKNGLISAKAGQLIQQYGDDPDLAKYSNMPITAEWSDEVWYSSQSAHWQTNTLRIARNELSGRQIYNYLEIAVDRDGVEQFRQHISSQHYSASMSWPQPETSGLPTLPEAQLRTWFESLSDSEKNQSQDMLWAACKSANPDHKITRQRIRTLTPDRKRGPKPIG